MTTRFYWQGDSATEEITAVRLSPEHRGGGLPTDARVGQVASGGIVVDDPNGALTFKTWRRFWVEDDEAPAGTQRLWTGYIANINVRRGDHFFGAVGRVWDLALADINAILHHRVVRSTDSGKRPAENDLQRLNWLLKTAWADNVLFTDLGLVDHTGPVDLDAVDYTGRYFGEILADLSNESGKNHFLVYHESADHRDLFYAANSSALYASTLRISNVAADIDNVSVFAPDHDAELQLDPSRKYAGIWMPYDGGTVYRTRTPAAGEVFRDGIAPAADVTTSAKATTLADRELAELTTDDEEISCSLWLPKDKISLIQPGHRMQVKLSHLPNVDTWRAARVVSHVIRQDEPNQSDDNYRLDLQLSIRPTTGTTSNCPLVPSALNQFSGGTATTPNDHEAFCWVNNECVPSQMLDDDCDLFWKPLYDSNNLVTLNITFPDPRRVDTIYFYRTDEHTNPDWINIYVGGVQVVSQQAGTTDDPSPGFRRIIYDLHHPYEGTTWKFEWRQPGGFNPLFRGRQLIGYLLTE